MENNIFDEANKIVWEAKQKYYRKQAIKARIRETVNDAAKFVCENADMICALLPVAAFGTRTIANMAKSAKRSADLRKERDLKELFCYDRSLGHYWELRRKLTNRDWVEINKRKMSGEKLGDILAELKLLK